MTLRFPPPTQSIESTSRRQIESDNYLTFRARLDSALPEDVHREFTGCYNARWRTIYMDEITTTARGDVKLLAVYPCDTYVRQENNDYFYSTDFERGKTLVLGRSLRDTSDVVKTYIITDVDKSKLKQETTSHYEGWAKEYPEQIIAILEKIKNVFIDRAGGNPIMGIKAIGRKFRVIDDDGNRRLSTEEFKKVMNESKIPLTTPEFQAIFRVFDRNGDGFISYDEFLYIIRGPLSEDRKHWVLTAYRAIDANKDGVLTLADLRRTYKGTDESIEKFLANWDTKQPNGIVTYDEFVDYYCAVSSSIDEDEVFVDMMRKNYGL